MNKNIFLAGGVVAVACSIIYLNKRKKKKKIERLEEDNLDFSEIMYGRDDLNVMSSLNDSRLESVEKRIDNFDDSLDKFDDTLSKAIETGDKDLQEKINNKIYDVIDARERLVKVQGLLEFNELSDFISDKEINDYCDGVDITIESLFDK